MTTPFAQKFVILDDSANTRVVKVFDGRTIKEETVHRIQAVKDFKLPSGREVNKGEFGGWVAAENNLDQVGSCWVFDDAVVCGNAVVKHNAVIEQRALVYGEHGHTPTVIRDGARITENVHISGSAAIIAGKSVIQGNVKIQGTVYIRDNVDIRDNVTIMTTKSGQYDDLFNSVITIQDKALIYDSAFIAGTCITIGDDACIANQCRILDRATIIGKSILEGQVTVADSACVKGESRLNGSIYLGDSARVSGSADIKGHSIAIHGDARITSNAVVRHYGALNLTITGNVVVCDQARLEFNGGQKEGVLITSKNSRDNWIIGYDAFINNKYQLITQDDRFIFRVVDFQPGVTVWMDSKGEYYDQAQIDKIKADNRMEKLENAVNGRGG